MSCMSNKKQSNKYMHIQCIKKITGEVCMIQLEHLEEIDQAVKMAQHIININFAAIIIIIQYEQSHL